MFPLCRIGTVVFDEEIISGDDDDEFGRWCLVRSAATISFFLFLISSPPMHRRTPTKRLTPLLPPHMTAQVVHYVRVTDYCKKAKHTHAHIHIHNLNSNQLFQKKATHCQNIPGKPGLQCHKHQYQPHYSVLLLLLLLIIIIIQAKSLFLLLTACYYC